MDHIIEEELKLRDRTDVAEYLKTIPEETWQRIADKLNAARKEAMAGKPEEKK